MEGSGSILLILVAILGNTLIKEVHGIVTLCDYLDEEELRKGIEGVPNTRLLKIDASTIGPASLTLSSSSYSADDDITVTVSATNNIANEFITSIVMQAFDINNINGPPVGTWTDGTTIQCNGAANFDTIYKVGFPTISTPTTFVFLARDLPTGITLVFRASFLVEDRSSTPTIQKYYFGAQSLPVSPGAPLGAPNLCSSIICYNGGACVNGVCNCINGYTGTYCESQSLSACNINPCQNGGTCSATGSTSYTCQCTLLYTGPTCQILSLSNPCSSFPCQNFGLCQVNGPANGPFAYTCQCQAPYTGFNCQIPSTPCEPNPCMNSGTCRLVGDSFECDCAAAWQGPFCDILAGLCDPNPCANGGTCAVSGASSFTCTCLPAFSGLTCTASTSDPCVPDPCNGGVCFRLPDGSIFVCTLCPDGVDTTNVGCAGTPCDGNPCDNGECTVTDGGDSFTCMCNEGWTKGANTEICNVPVITSPCEPNPCFNSGTCFRLQADAAGIACVCLDGFNGDFCEIDSGDGPCAGNPCQNGQCTEAGSSYTCTCNEGWTKESNSEICNVQDLCSPDPCVNGVCRPDGSCICGPGYMGDTCEEEGACFSEPCLNGGLCIPVHDSNFTMFNETMLNHTMSNYTMFTCNCSANFTGEFCEAPVDPCEDHSCMNDGVCEPVGLQDYTCQCPETHRGDFCEEEVTCASQSFDCGEGGDCQDLQQGPLCICKTGYQGARCEITPCDGNPCLNGGTCRIDNDARPGGYRCTCREGYSGTNCEIDRCTNYDCGNGQCRLQNNQPQCDCDGGFSGDRCEISICDGRCQNGGTCRINNNNGQATCSCTPGWTGDICSMDVDECSLGGGSACNNAVSCTNTQGDFICECEPGYFGQRCDTADTNECDSNPCFGSESVCVDLVGKYQCICPIGKMGINCNLTDYCKIEDGNPCSPEGLKTCLSVKDGKLCSCKDGFKGTYCNQTDTNGNTANGKQSALDNLPLDPWWLALIGLIVLLFIIFIIIVICTQCYGGNDEYNDKYYRS